MKWDGPFDSLSAASTHHSPPPLQFVSGSIGSTSPSELESLPPINFSPIYALPTTELRKRKSTAITGSEAASKSGSGRQPRGKKISHNVIEKRYRSNLNDKIAKLRDSVPELRSAPPAIKRRPQKPIVVDSDGSGDEASQGLKFNKATVLVKATEYIQQLERQNQRLLTEVSSLRNRGGSKNQAKVPPIISTAIPAALSSPAAPVTPAEGNVAGSAKAEIESTPDDLNANAAIQDPVEVKHLREEAPSQSEHVAEASTSATDTAVTIPPWSEVKGMIPLPESWQRFRAATRSEEHYAPPSPVSHVPELDDISLGNDDTEGSRWSKSRMMSRVLVGSLAGLMIMEGFSEREEDTPQLKRRGLFSLPKELLTESRGFRVPIRKRIVAFAASGKARQALPVLAFSLVFLAVFLIVFAYSIPERSKAIREGSTGKEKSIQHSEANGTDASPAQVPPHVIDNTTSSPNARHHSSIIDIYAVKLAQWLGLSWFIWQDHDEEAASRHNEGASMEKRWLSYLRVIPKFGEDIQSL